MSALRGFAVNARRLIRQSWHLTLARGLPRQPLLRFVYAVKLPFALVRAVSADPQLARRFHRGVTTQLIVVGLLSYVFAPSALGGIEYAADHGAEILTTPRGVEIEFGDTATKKAERDALKPPPTPPSKKTAGDDEEEDLDIELGSKPRKVPPPPPSPLLLVIGSIWGAIKVADWIVGAFFREPNDALTHDVSTRYGAVTEEAIPNPRVRFSFRWALGRIKKQLLAALAIASGFPFFLATFALPYLGSALRATLVAVWGLYWLAVLTTAKTAAAWVNETPPQPWFVRAWQRVLTMRGFNWFLPKLYGRLLERVAAKLLAPAEAFEHARWQLAGLTLVRIIAGFPFASTFLKPMLPVAAGYLVRGEAFTGLSRECEPEHVAERVTPGTAGADATVERGN